MYEAAIDDAAAVLLLAKSPRGGGAAANGPYTIAEPPRAPTSGRK
jgi:hypothetical protein